MADKYSQGYERIAPSIDKMTVSNLVNFTEPSSHYSETGKNIKRMGMSALIFLVYLFAIWGISRLFEAWWLALVLIPLLIPIPLRTISLIVFNERKVAKDYKLRKQQQNNLSVKMVFQCYDMTDTYPYILYNTDGTISVVLELVRRTRVGEAKKKAFLHAEALSEFYNLALQMGINIKNIDIQSANTKDERFDGLYAYLPRIKNPTIESIVSSIYRHLEANSKNTVLSYEYVVLNSQMNESVFWDNVLVLINALQATYKRVTVLDETKISEMIRSLFGFETFELRNIMQEVAADQGTSTLKLLWVGDNQGRRKKINQSEAEIREQYLKVKEEPVSEEVVQPKEQMQVENTLVDLFDTGSKGVESVTSVLEDEEPDRVSSKTKRNFPKPVEINEDSKLDIF